MIPFSGFRRSGVHANRKYCFIGLFLQNNPFNQIPTLQFSSHRLFTFFATSYMSREGAKGSRKPAVARQIDHVGELGLWGFFWFFSSFTNDSVFYFEACGVSASCPVS
jgi:hypothetical protein